MVGAAGSAATAAKGDRTKTAASNNPLVRRRMEGLRIFGRVEVCRERRLQPGQSQNPVNSRLSGAATGHAGCAACAGAAERIISTAAGSMLAWRAAAVALNT